MCVGEKVPHWAELDEGLLVSVVALKHTTGMAGRTVVVVCIHVRVYVERVTFAGR